MDDSKDQAGGPVTGVILLYHGSAEEEWARAARTLAAKVAGMAPRSMVETACVKDFSPSAEDAARNLARAGVTRALVAPMFIAPGGHVARDFPVLAGQLKARWPGVEFIWTDVVGVWEEVAQAVAAGVNRRLGEINAAD